MNLKENRLSYVSVMMGSTEAEIGVSNLQTPEKELQRDTGVSNSVYKVYEPSIIVFVLFTVFLEFSTNPFYSLKLRINL